MIRRRQWHSTPVPLPGKSHGQRSLVAYSPWGRYKSDTTEWLHFHFSLSCTGEGNGNPLQYSCLENSRDRRAWGARVHGGIEWDNTEQACRAQRTRAPSHIPVPAQKAEVLSPVTTQLEYQIPSCPFPTSFQTSWKDGKTALLPSSLLTKLEWYSPRSGPLRLPQLWNKGKGQAYHQRTLELSPGNWLYVKQNVGKFEPKGCF